MKIFPSSMAKLARRYLAHRRGFGYRLQGAGYDLLAFARFLDRAAPGQPLSTKLALQWLKTKQCQPVTIAVRLSTIRGFARFCATLDPRTQIPSTHLFPRRDGRRAPHIFTDAGSSTFLVGIPSPPSPEGRLWDTNAGSSRSIEAPMTRYKCLCINAL
jgi:site-specific recombinase XerD